MRAKGTPGRKIHQRLTILRRTVATRLAEMGIQKEDRDAILNHTPQDVGKKHYDLYEREGEKRSALNAWSGAITAMLSKQRASRG